MRKYLIGFLVGLLAAIATTTHADTIKSYVGKVIQGEFPLRIDSKALEKNALVIDGVSYVPVRAFSSVFGYKVLFNAETGIDLFTGAVVSSSSEVPAATAQPNIGTSTVTGNVYDMAEINHQITLSNKMINLMKQTIVNDPEGPNAAFERTQLKAYEDELVLWEERKTEFKNKLK